MKTYEESIQDLMEDPSKNDAIKHSYFDFPRSKSAKRFVASDEWREAKKLINEFFTSGKVLDLGAGHGVSSYAFGLANWDVTACDPDLSDLVGLNAARDLHRANKVNVRHVSCLGEGIPFEPNTFDVVYCRQVLHHANNLHLMTSEVRRVLKPNGVFLACREHVVNNERELNIFLERHILHSAHGSENAYRIDEYTSALRDAGFRNIQIIGTLESMINFYPGKKREKNRIVLEALVPIISNRFKLPLVPKGILVILLLLAFPFLYLVSNKFRSIFNLTAHQLSERVIQPGKMYTFLAIK